MNEAVCRTLRAGLAVERGELDLLRARIERLTSQRISALAHAAEREKNIAELLAALQGSIESAAFRSSAMERCEDAAEAIRSGSASLCDVLEGRCPFFEKASA